MLRSLTLCALFSLGAAALTAQQPRREALERQVVERFIANYRAQAGLTAEQDARFRTVAMRSFNQRRERAQRERQLWQALEGQMRPGVAANADSVSKVLDALSASRLAGVEQMRADDREYATFLSPVQRAQLYLQVERLQRNIEDMLRRRMQQGIGGAPPEQ